MNAGAALRVAKFLRTPGWAATWAHEFIDDRIRDPRHRRYLDDYEAIAVETPVAVSRVTGNPEPRVRDVLSEGLPFLSSSPGPSGTGLAWSASESLASVCYAVCRLVEPEVVVETGVGAGVSSWAWLLAMQKNGRGALHSIDLPTPNTELLPAVGHLVPDELRDRWSLQFGSSRKLLPSTFGNLGTIDVFLHDSRHSYSNQLMEYRAAWPRIRPGGILLSDDVRNDALYEAARDWGVELTIARQDKNSPIGLVVKPEQSQK
jgi:predicted O-methyltransferase YrrM